MLGFGVAGLLASSCAGPGGEGAGAVGPDPDDATETDLAHHDTDVRSPRPLCLSDATSPPIRADLLGWIRAARDGRNRFYGAMDEAALEALGEVALGSPEEEVPRRIERAWFRMRRGDIDLATADADAAVALAVAQVPAWRGRAREVAATVWVRKAELDNCVADGTGEACLVPFTEAAVHQREEGMRRASELLLAFLSEDDSGKLAPRWMLNVAHMALGDWPDAVPFAWRVDPSRMASEADVPAWHNIAPDIGLAREPEIAGGAALEDLDGDGLLDLVTSSMQPEVGMRVLLNTGDGDFCDATEASGLANVVGVLNFSLADYDNDGDMDLLAPRGAWLAQDGRAFMSLMRNDGAGRFEDVTFAAGMGNVAGPSQVSIWADVDRDGWLDCFVGRESTPDAPDGAAPSSLYMNLRDGTFRDVAADVGLDQVGFIKGAAWGDVDDDGDPDLYVSLINDRNRLFTHDGDVFRVSALSPLVGDPEEGFAAGFLDYDQDGDLDIYGAAYPNLYAQEGVLSDNYGRSAEGYVASLLGVPTAAATQHLYRNDRTTLTDVTVQVGLDDVHATMGASFGDLNADGWPDLYLGTGAPEFDAIEPNTAYLNARGARFLDVSSGAHLGHLQKGHGISFGDVDEDGDEDIFADIGGAFTGDGFPDALFVNPTPSASTVTLRLVGVEANRFGVGARVRVRTPGRDFFHTVGATASFGNNSHQLEVGLDGWTGPVRVEIAWPSGTWGEVQVVDGVEPGHIVTIRQGDGVLSQRPFTRIPLPQHEVAAQ
jgi:hypothetical protein